jgi:hypothetical protein
MLMDKIGLPHDLQVRIVEILRSTRPYAYCDSCLALALQADVEAARHAALHLAGSPLFNRKFGICGACGQAVDLTYRR